MRQVYEGAVCPAANVCARVDSSAAACGTDVNHVQALSLAEEVCPAALQGWTESQQSLLPAGIREVFGAWGAQELELSTPDVDQAEAHARESQKRIRTVLMGPYMKFNNLFSVALLSTYAPAFRGRKMPQPIGETDIREVRQGLHLIRGAIERAPVHQGERDHLRVAAEEGVSHTPCLQQEGDRGDLTAKTLCLELALRRGWVLYPASPREHTRGQIHDAYAIDGTGKVPAILRNRGRGEFQGSQVEAVSLSVGALVQDAINRMRANPKQYGRMPNNGVSLQGIASLLKADLDNRLDTRSATFLDMMGVSMEDRLSLQHRGRHTSLRPLRADAVPSAPTMPDRPAARVDHTLYKGDTERPWTPSQAAEYYYRDGNTQEGVERLERLARAMRDNKDPYISTTCAGVYLDLARHPSLSTEESLAALDMAMAHVPRLSQSEIDNLSAEDLSYRFRWELQRAYSEKYRMTLSGQALTMAEEYRLFSDLLELGRSTLAPCASQTDEAVQVRGIQFEIGVHLLNARRNLRTGALLHAMWPSLPREDAPHDDSFEISNGWDAGFTDSSFIDQGLGCGYLQFKSAPDGRMYDPSITVVCGQTDLGTRTSADIILLVLHEIHGGSERKAQATAQLQAVEEAFLNTVGMSAQ